LLNQAILRNTPCEKKQGGLREGKSKTIPLGLKNKEYPKPPDWKVNKVAGKTLGKLSTLKKGRGSNSGVTLSPGREGNATSEKVDYITEWSPTGRLNRQPWGIPSVVGQKARFKKKSDERFMKKKSRFGTT